RPSAGWVRRSKLAQAGAAPSSPDGCEAASPRLELTAEPPAAPPVVCISPDVPLTLRFDTPLQPGSVRLQERERFEEVNPGQQTLTLVPPKELEAGARFTLDVCFADGAAPACASFDLRTHPALGLSQVKVFRKPRTVESFREGEKAAQAEAQQCQEEVRQLRAQHGAPEGLRGVLASGLLGKVGILFKTPTKLVTEAKGNALRLKDARSYRTEGRVAVDLWLDNSGTLPWVAAGAVLRGPKGEVLKPLPLWQQEPGAEGWRRVVVEVPASETEARGPYTLVLWDADQKRTVTLGHVTFP
ncbi:MAG TPA: DUF2381 family protein, partial [Archangium sp.]|nr:DUF2381 family protein [Archangium sp.]